MRLRKTAWIFMLAAFLLPGCGKDSECDFISVFINQADGSGAFNFHDVPGNSKIAQQFQPSSSFTLGAVSFTIRKVGNPVGTLRVTIHRDDVNKPDEDHISDGGPVTVDFSEVGGDFLSEVMAVFPGEPVLSSGIDYYFVIDFTGDVNSTDFFVLGGTSIGSAFPDGDLWRFNRDETVEDKAWSPFGSEDLQFTIWKCEDSG